MNPTSEYLHKVIDDQLRRAMNQDLSATQRAHAVTVAHHLSAAVEMIESENDLAKENQ